MGLVLFPDYDFKYVPVCNLSFDDTFLYYEEPCIIPSQNCYNNITEDTFCVKLIDGGKVKYINIDRTVLKLKIDMHCIGDPVKTEYGSLDPGSVFKVNPKSNIVYMKLCNGFYDNFIYDMKLCNGFYDNFIYDNICLNEEIQKKEMNNWCYTIPQNNDYSIPYDKCYTAPPYINDHDIVYKYTNVKLKGFMERTYKTKLSELNPGDIFIANNCIFMYIMQYEDYYYLLDLINNNIIMRVYDIDCLKISDIKFSWLKINSCSTFDCLSIGDTFVRVTNPRYLLLDSYYGDPYVKIPNFSINNDFRFNAIRLTDGTIHNFDNSTVVIKKDFYIK